jgi:hypothetical protein
MLRKLREQRRAGWFVASSKIRMRPLLDARPRRIGGAKSLT